MKSSSSATAADAASSSGQPRDLRHMTKARNVVASWFSCYYATYLVPKSRLLVQFLGLKTILNDTWIPNFDCPFLQIRISSAEPFVTAHLLMADYYNPNGYPPPPGSGHNQFPPPPRTQFEGPQYSGNPPAPAQVRSRSPSKLFRRRAFALISRDRVNTSLPAKTSTATRRAPPECRSDSTAGASTAMTASDATLALTPPLNIAGAMRATMAVRLRRTTTVRAPAAPEESGSGIGIGNMSENDRARGARGVRNMAAATRPRSRSAQPCSAARSEAVSCKNRNGSFWCAATWKLT